MAVLGDQLLLSSSREASPRGRIHVFSLQAAHLRTVDFEHLGNCNVLVAAHGRLYATEFGEEEEGMDMGERYESLRSQFGKRVLVLSPQLEVIHVFTMPGESTDLFGIAPRGSNLLITDYDNDEVHEIAVGPTTAPG